MNLFRISHFDLYYLYSNSTKTDNVKWNGLIRYDWNNTNYEADGDHRGAEENNLKLRFEPSITINENWTGHSQIDYNIDVDNTADLKHNSDGATGSITVEKIWTEGVYGKADIKLGRFGSFSDASHGLVFDTRVTGAEVTYAPTENWKVKATAGRYHTNGDLAISAGDVENGTYWAVEAGYQNGKWDAGIGYHNVTATETFQDATSDDGSFRVVDLGVGYAFDKNVKLTADYAFGPSVDQTGNLKEAAKNAYSIQLNYKGANAADKGSWGAYVAYRSLAPFAAFEATYDHKKGNAGFNSLKGWEIGADYAWAKNIVSTLKYFNGKDTLRTTDDKVTGVWSRVDFLF